MLKIYESTIKAIDLELVKAADKFPGRFNSGHEGYAVLKQEADELWDQIKANGPDEKLYHEATRIAAMAIKFMQECCGKVGYND